MKIIELTEAQRRVLGKLEIKILRAFPSSPRQAELKHARLALLAHYGFDNPEQVGIARGI